MSLDIQVSKVIKALKKLPVTYNKEKKKMLRKAAKPLIKAIKRRAPKDTGKLKSSIKVLPLKKTSNVFVGAVYGPKGQFKGNHAHLLEYGTIMTRAQPFIKPGFEASKGVVATKIEEGSREILEGYKAKNSK